MSRYDPEMICFDAVRAESSNKTEEKLIDGGVRMMRYEAIHCLSVEEAYSGVNGL